MSPKMYRENRKSLNWFVGCRHGCIYCVPSFQRQMKRQGKRCQKCYRYEPHAHLERLLKPPPKTEGDEFIFFPSSGDPVFANRWEMQAAIDYTRKFSDRTFLIQSKNPTRLRGLTFPENVILGTTIETDLFKFPSHFYNNYAKICPNAPLPINRAFNLFMLNHKRKAITVEPILAFTSMLTVWIKTVNPEIVYVGYDNHNCKLPEPPLSETKKLIESLEKFTEVRVKTLRKAWYEK